MTIEEDYAELLFLHEEFMHEVKHTMISKEQVKEVIYDLFVAEYENTVFIDPQAAKLIKRLRL